MTNMKTCSKCKKTKAFNMFYKDKSTKDGYRYECKECSHIGSKNYYNNNRGHILNKQKNRTKDEHYYEGLRKSQKKYRDSKIGKQRRKEYRKKNQERIQYITKKYKDNHKEHIDEWNKLYTEEHREEGRERCRNHYLNNKQYYLSKTDRRRRNFNRIQLFDNPFPEEIEVDYHHVNNMIVIPIPTISHRKILGKNHRLLGNKLIYKIYGLDINKLIGDSI